MRTTLVASVGFANFAQRLRGRFLPDARDAVPREIRSNGRATADHLGFHLREIATLPVVARAKAAADNARKAAASLALWLTASLLAGALASMLGATEGGLLRDSRWYEPGWRAKVTRTH
jgi:hypothetical protein